MTGGSGVWWVPGSRVVPAGLLDPVPQDADVAGHHVVQSLQILLDSPELHRLLLSLLGPADKNKDHTEEEDDEEEQEEARLTFLRWF